MVATKMTRSGVVEIYPKFVIYNSSSKSSDLMIRGGDFYAIWVEERGMWSTDEQDALMLIDRELDEYAKQHKEHIGPNYRVLHMWDAESGMIDSWHKYCQKQMRDSFHMLDEHLIFSNSKTNKKDYASKKLSYPLEPGPFNAYDRLMSVLYSPEERHKVEWAIGAIVTGDSKTLQKFVVLYGEPKSGKSTILNIIQKLFDGYCSAFDARALGSSSNSFALEAFKSNPLVAIQHDGDLSRIEDNTRLNSLVSHELMTVNEKFKSTYVNRFKCFLFMGTNKPVKITDAKSGLIRRLIDVTPTGDKVSKKEYDQLNAQIDFELGAIACHCRDIYLADPNYYNDYIPLKMLGASNDFYNFVEDSYYIFKKDDGVSFKAAWEMYKVYCEEARVPFPLSQRVFKEELKNYFREFKERFGLEDGSRVRSYYYGFRTDKFEGSILDISQPSTDVPDWLNFHSQESILDSLYSSCPAQYATADGKPIKKWEKVDTALKDLDTSKIHYVMPPSTHIVIDFDIPDEDGSKSLTKNIEAAKNWPPTYAELSKSGCGIHLHYIYEGDETKLKPIYAPHVEVKVFTGNSSLRRKLTKCNNLQLTTINSGLPIKEKKKVVNIKTVQSEKGLRRQIEQNLRKEIHGATKPSVDFIKKILDDAYESGLVYDVSDMRSAIFHFAANSTNNADYCMRLVPQMKFKSEAPQENNKDPDVAGLVFFDVEVFPNLFVCCWKKRGVDQVHSMINPSSSDIENLLQMPLVGFNNRRYDNHILYGRLLGYSELELYNLSQSIISGNKNAFFGKAYNLSYTDIYDFSSKKQSLKKFEIELGIHHQELGLPWDKPVPEELWEEVVKYCKNDVIATEIVFESKDRQADFLARKILAEVAGMSVNDTTNSLSTRIIFGGDRTPQTQFNYRFMGEVPSDARHEVIASDGCFYNFDDEYTLFDTKGRPVFKGYTFEKGKSLYRGEEVGEGGRVNATPGMHTNVALLDVESMHPTSAIEEDLFGEEYTKRFKELKQVRIHIKHGQLDEAKKLLGGKLTKFLTDPDVAESLSQALKIVINSVYGLTSAGFENAFRDKRNIDNIVAKRGALFMINLENMVEQKGFHVAHTKTDSVKIPGATPEIISFVMDYGHAYGYNFEHEATYEKMCLVNDAVYIAKYASAEQCEAVYGYVPKKNAKNGGKWTATGTQFQIPYVFKTLFSKEDIEFTDLCVTKEVTNQPALYLDFNEGLPDTTLEENELKERETNPESTKKFRRQFIDISTEELQKRIDESHKYTFVGKVGSFCPIKDGYGGGLLMAKTKNGNYVYATGAKGYRWKEAEIVKELNQLDQIDYRYFDELCDKARDAISKYGDFSWFVSDDPIEAEGPVMQIAEDLPWEKTPCGREDQTCFDCIHYHAQDGIDEYCDKGFIFCNKGEQ